MSPITISTGEELAFPALVSCFFWLWYSFVDVMAVGKAKQAHPKEAGLLHRANPADVPEDIILAQRAQMNQVEQMPGFFIGMWTFSLFVDARIGAGLGLLWVVLRALYASTYRNGAGKKFLQMGLLKYTIPCYLILNFLCAGTIVTIAMKLFM
eukprot:TRINITY_DN656_c0_g1_i1.p2 TRINITY_DN656_c0_g1~~TRINITY_DN656_c0_g1_i1.p2  ORF type:complete len:174 (+),score=57.83 TRINITY_DN656_c0_g1_i1:64-522(+)